MKVTEYSAGTDAQLVLAGMITSDHVLARIASKWEGPNGVGGHFAAPWANDVADLCVRYHRRYGKAPGEGISNLFTHWSERHQADPERIQLTEAFLAQLSEGHARNGEAPANPEFVVDVAARHFLTNRLRRLKSEIAGALDNNDLDRADQLAAGYTKVQMGSTSAKDLFTDEEAVRAAFAHEAMQVVVPYEGALGHFLARTFHRGAFVAFAGPQKVGKTYWLLDVAYRARRRRKRVAFFEVGDLFEPELDTLLLEREAMTPSWGDKRPPLTVQIPVEDSMRAPDPKQEVKVPATLVWESQVFDRVLDADAAWEACQTVQRKHVCSSRSYFRRQVFPNLGVSVEDLREVIDGWISTGWVPDVIVIDYADNLAAVNKHEREPREKVNDTWKRLRAMATTYSACVVTATQVNVAGFKAYTLHREHFSEDNRKMNHVTAMLGINAMAEEKEQDITRLNYIIARRIPFSWRTCCHVAGCRSVSHVSMASALWGWEPQKAT